MKVINSKIAAIGLAAFVFASCSDSNSDPTGPTPNVELAETITANLTSSSAAELAARVSNYKNTTANARKFFFSRATQTRAFASADKVVIPAVPDNARQWSAPEDMKAGKTYLVTSKKTLDMSGYNVAGATIFVKGNSKLIFNSSIAGCKIYVDGGATLEYKGTGALEIPADATIINDGGSIIAENDINVAGKLYAKYTNDGSGIGSINPYDKNDQKAIITPKHNITFKQGSDAFIGGSLHAVELNIEEGATVNITKHIMNATTVNVNGALQFGGFLRTETLNVKGELKASEKSAIKASKVFNAEAGSRITADYINVTNKAKDATLYLKGDCQININNKSDIYTNNIVTDNTSRGQITLNDDNAIAVIKAKKFTNTGANQIQALATTGTNATYLLQFTECYTGSEKEKTFEDLDIAASYLDYDKATDGKGVTEKEDGADYKSYGYEWAGDPNAIIAAPKLDLIAEDKTPNNGMSATCIQPATNGDMFYVAYHTNGKASNGAIEAIKLEGNKLSIKQNVATSNSTNDYNHILAEGNTLWVAGSQRGNKNHADTETGMGTFLGKITLESDGTFADSIRLNAIDRKTQNMDANCVASFKDNHIVATTKGFTIFNAKMNKWNEGNTEGKYLLTANDKLYALTLDGTLTAYNDNAMEEVAGTYNVGEISPKGNKTVIAADTNGDLYVCKGENGISKVAADGTVSQFFECPTFTASKDAQNLEAGKEYVKGCANGVCVSGDYVYVACGSYGLVVLDKTTGKQVCHRKAYNGKSANFVTVKDNKIFVAYGQSRVQVFALATTK